MNAEQKYFSGLDYLRVCAALFVFASHFSQVFGGHFSGRISTISWMDEFGNVGVDLFFVLSGFVIAQSISYRGQFEIAKFIKGRLRRILPIYWTLTLAAAIALLFAQAVGIPFEIRRFDLLHFITSVLFLSQATGSGLPLVAQGWSLEFEIAFYVMASLTLLFHNRRNFRLFLISVTLGFASVTISPMFMEFAFGVGIFILRKKIPDNLRRWKVVTVNISAAILLILVGPSGLDNRWLAWGIPSSFVLLGLSLLKHQKGTSFVRALGQASYPFYLLQWFTLPISAILLSDLQPWLFLPVFLVILALTGAASHLVVNFWDAPIKQRLIKNGW